MSGVPANDLPPGHQRPFKRLSVPGHTVGPPSFMTRLASRWCSFVQRVPRVARLDQCRFGSWFAFYRNENDQSASQVGRSAPYRVEVVCAVRTITVMETRVFPGKAGHVHSSLRLIERTGVLGVNGSVRHIWTERFSRSHTLIGRALREAGILQPNGTCCRLSVWSLCTDAVDPASLCSGRIGYCVEPL